MLKKSFAALPIIAAGLCLGVTAFGEEDTLESSLAATDSEIRARVDANNRMEFIDRGAGLDTV